MMKALLLLVLLAIVWESFSATSSSSSVVPSKRGLVVVDNLNVRNTHSRFFSLLERKGYTLDFHQATDTNIELSKYGEYKYGFLVLFAPRAEEFGSRMDVDSILNFIDDGVGNVIFAADSEISDINRDLATECGITFGNDKNYVIDHHNFDISDFDGDHTLILADSNSSSPVISGSNPRGPILFRGIDQYLEDNELLTPILFASPYAYGASPEDAVSDTHSSSGKRPVLISALQARNNARILISGSLDLFSDKFFTSKVQRYSVTGASSKEESSGNEELVSNLVAWTLKEKGVIRASNVTHHLEGQTEPLDMYKVTDKLYYSIDIEEWNGKEWAPYRGDDVKLEFTMLDPYVRTGLTYSGGKTYSTTFKIPDVYGIFTFRVRLEKSGYTSVLSEKIVTIRPFKHNEYDRFIVAAYPYYASAFSMMFGLFVFSFFFLYTKERTPQAKAKTT